MIRYLSVILSIVLLGAEGLPGAPAPQARADDIPQAGALLGVFEGRTPCGPVANAFTGFPSQNCEKIKWELSLYRDAAKEDPGTYAFRGTRTSRQGRWTIERRAGPEQHWTVYHLAAADGARVLSLLRVDDNVLLVLDADLKVLVGDPSWSYALNRTDPPVK